MNSTRNKIAKLLNEMERCCPQDRSIHIMEVCGTHTHAIGKSGLRQLLPKNIRLISGPGCPVCVTHDGEIDAYLNLSLQKDVIIATFGDLMRVPGSQGSLSDARAKGAKIEVVYSPLEAVKIARANPDQEVIFLGVGFETTAPAVAMAIMTARAQGADNFSVLSMHKQVPPALEALLKDEQVQVDGFILPGHVCTITGVEPFEFLPARFGKGGVITGFDPVDIAEAVSMLLLQMAHEHVAIENQYLRGVPYQGNPVAREAVAKVFEAQDAWWRGLGPLPMSGLGIREEFAAFDVKNKFQMHPIVEKNQNRSSGCACGDILKGIKTPDQCRLFGKACTPLSPVGPCMVSSEGTCAAYHHYAEYREG